MDKELKYKLSLQDLFTKKMEGAIGQTKRLDNSMSGLGSKITAVIGGIAAVSLGKTIVNTTAKYQAFDNAIKTASGSALEGQKNLSFLNDQVDRLGLDINAAYSGYKTFSGALMGSVLAGEKANTIFRQVSEASTVMGLTGEQTEGAFLALGQMISKGKVQAEELRGQLGERIPGAFQIAARAMNMTTAELDDFMKDGKLIAEDFLPKFGAELERTFGKKAGEASDSLQSNLNRLNTEWERLKVTIGTEFLPELMSAVKGITSFVKENKELIVTGIKVAAVVGGITLAVKAGMLAYSGITAAMELATTANVALNLSLGTTLGTVGLLTAGFAAMGVAIYGAYSASQELKAIQEGEARTNPKKVIDEEVGSLNRLADRYTQLGRSKKDAMTLAIQQERKNLTLDISDLEKNQASNPNEANRRLLESKRLSLSALDNEKSLISEYANNKNMASASSGKAGRSSSSASVGSSTEVSTARPQSITINIGKMVETFELHTTNVTEGFEKIKQKLGNMLAEVANDANNIGMVS
jgi:tape measure domain-containing protein